MNTQTFTSEAVKLTYREITALTDLLQTRATGNDLVGSLEALESNVDDEAVDKRFADLDEDLRRFLQNRRARIQPRVDAGYRSLRRRGLIEKTDDGKYVITNKVLKVYAALTVNPHATTPFAFVHKSSTGENRHVFTLMPDDNIDAPILEQIWVPPTEAMTCPTFFRCVPDTTSLVPHVLNMLSPLLNLPEEVACPTWYHPVNSTIGKDWIEEFCWEYPYVYELLRDVDVPDKIARRLSDNCVEASTYYGISNPPFSPLKRDEDEYGFVFAIPAPPGLGNDCVWLIQSGRLASDVHDAETVPLKIKMVSGRKAVETIVSRAVETVAHIDISVPSLSSEWD